MISRVVRPARVQRGERLEQQIEALLRLEPADRADHDVVAARSRATRASRLRGAAIAQELPVVDAVEDGRDARPDRRRGATSSRAISLDTAISRGKRREHALVDRVVAEPLARQWPVQPCTVASGARRR